MPCRTIEFTIDYRTRNNDILKIDNQFSKKGRTFTVNKTIRFKQNLTIIGINGRPIVSSNYMHYLEPLLLFYNEQSGRVRGITLTVINIWFKRVSLVEFTKIPDVVSIKITKCSISQFGTAVRLFSNSDMSSIVITIQDTKMVGFFRGIVSIGVGIKIYVTNSTFKSDKRKSNMCSKFIHVTRASYFEAVLSELTFKSVHALSSTTASTEKPAFINISNCRFYDEFYEDWTRFKTWYCDGGVSATRATVILYNNSISGHATFHGDSTFRFSATNLSISNCVFENNRGHNNIRALEILSHSHALLSNCSFRNNVGGAVSLTSGAINFKNCRFINNSATAGGAVNVKHASGLTVFEDCYFENNTASSFSVYNLNGQGGALEILSSNIYILRCSFHTNKAKGPGSSISQENGELFIENSVFDMSFDSNMYNGGGYIYSASAVVMSNVSINEIDRWNAQSHLMTAKTLRIERNVDIKCSSGKNVIVYGYQKHGDLQAINVFCSSCSANKYSLLSGKATFYLLKLDRFFQISNYTVTNIDCFKCPFGGICEKGHIRAMNNFWGYLEDGTEVHFASCPIGYCCTGKSCKTFNSCASGRQGALCSKCKEGLLESVTTTDCLEPTNCPHRPWFWFIIIFFGICYFFFLLHMKEAAVLFNALLCPNVTKIFLTRNSISENETPLLTESDNHEQEEDIQEYEGENKKVKDSKTDSLFTGLFEIVVFFYQVDVLYEVYSTEEKPHNSFRIMKETLSTLFNLRIDGKFYEVFFWCPFRNVTPITKVLFKMSFVFYLMSLVLMTYVAATIYRLCKKEIGHVKSVFRRLIPCFLRLLLISYATITSALFSLLSCVKINSSVKVLFIDGSVQCYQWWQYIVIAFIVCWVVFLPVSIYASSWLLHKGRMTGKMLMFNLMFPPASILYWAFIRLCTNKKSRINLSNEATEATVRTDEKHSLEKEILKQFLEIMEGPFRETKTTPDKKLSWECVLITRRLILIFVKTFIMNTVVKLFVMLFFTVLFVMHHLTMKPFPKPILNHVETCSLMMLTVICALNVIPAYNYMYPFSASPFSQNLVQIFLKIETTLRFIFPAIVAFFVILLLFIRLMQLIACMTRKIVMIIYFCIRRISS